MKTWTARKISALKGKAKIVCLTAYDHSMARLIDEAGVQLILVGDTLAMTVLGYETTLPVTVDEMLHHTRAVVRGVKSALVVADMPFMSYQVTDEDGIRNAGRFIKEALADAVKIEGGAIRAGLVRRLVQNGIPVLGHIGLTPQSIRQMGGYRVQGRREEDAQALLADARALAAAGAFAIVLECIPAALAADITAAVDVPTVGIGAGASCDGQILVTPDLLGLYADVSPKFVKQYANLGAEIRQAIGCYRQEVETGVFPAAEHTY
jgi:3-methyl-2-oxobutanoate hydroxymethyltransferase